MASSRGEEHDERDKIRLYKNKIREASMEFNDPLARVRAPTQQELKITEGISTTNTGDMNKVARSDEHEEESRKWRAHDRNVRKFRCSCIQGIVLKRAIVLLNVYVVLVRNQYKTCDFVSVL